MAPKAKNIYAVGTIILCKHKNVFYEAKIMDVLEPASADPIYVVHYKGWHKRYDEQVRHSQADDMFLEASKDNISQTTLLRETLENSSKKKRKSRVDNVTDDELRPSEAGSRASSPSDKAGSHVSSIKAKGTKRKANDSPATDASKNDNIMIVIPKPLRQVLVDDHDVIGKNHLYRLPAKISVRDIIKEYTNQLGMSDSDTKKDEMFIEYVDGQTIQASSTSLVLSAHGIIDYFDSLLSYQLLYKFERPQYAKFVEEQKANSEGQSSKRRRTIASEQESSPPEDFKPSSAYGYPHLLRFLSRMPSILKHSVWDEHVLQTILNSVHDFVVFLNKNNKKYFDVNKDYEAASAEYIRNAQQAESVSNT